MYSTATLLQAKDTNTLEDLHTALSSTNYCYLNPTLLVYYRPRTSTRSRTWTKPFPGKLIRSASGLGTQT